MNKQAGLINAGFAAMDLADGAKKIPKAFNSPNKYDKALNGDSQKVSKHAEQFNEKCASEVIDELCKQAGIKMPNMSGVKKGLGKAKSFVEKVDTKNTQHLNNMVNGIKNKNITKTLNEGMKAAPVTLPALAGMGLAGVGTSKTLKKLDKKKSPEKDIEYNTIGAGVTAGLALTALKNKRMLKPAGVALGLVRDKLVKYPVDSVKKVSPGAKFVADVAKNTAKKGADAVKAMGAEKDRAVNMAVNIEKMMGGKTSVNMDTAVSRILRNQKNDFYRKGAYTSTAQELDKLWAQKESALNKQILMAKDLINNKKASDELDEIQKIAGAKTDYAKKLFTEHFLKKGLESIPYYAAPAAVGFALNRDVRHSFKKFKDDRLGHKIDEPEKVASINNARTQKVLHTALERGAEGLGRTVFPAAIGVATGRNIMNSFKPIEKEDSQKTPQENMANSIVINISGNPTKRQVNSEVSKKLDELKKNASEESEQVQDIGDVVEEVLKAVGKSGNVKGTKVHIGNGVKKQFRMNQ